MPTGIYPRTEEHKRKISQGLIGHKGTSFKHSEEAKEKISKSLIGNTRSVGREPWNKGKPLSEDIRLKLSLSSRGNKTWKYIDGNSLKRGSDWKWIRRKVKERDNYTCQACGCINKVLQVHHIISYKEFPDNLLTNLIALCISCHRRIEAGNLCLLILPVKISNP